MATPQARSGASLLALADQCVQCGLCLPHCPTYRLDACESESPRGRIAYIKAVAGGELAATAAGDLHLDHCLGCLRCETVCPARVQYGALLAGARASQFDREPPGPAVHWRLWLLARPRWLAAALDLYRHVFPLLPPSLRPLPRPPQPAKPAQPMATVDSPSVGSAPVAVFIGCIAGRYEAGTRLGLLRLLAAAGVAASLPARQGCCGTAAAYAGDVAAADALATSNRAAFIGAERVLCLASGCRQTLADSLSGVAEVEDALAFLAGRGDRLRFRSAQGRRVALHLPCSQLASAGSEAALRRLLARVPDLDLLELPDTGCCGAAGLHMAA